MLNDAIGQWVQNIANERNRLGFINKLVEINGFPIAHVKTYIQLLPCM